MLLFMDSNYAVVVYQPERTDCAKCSSPLDSVEVARNLLSSDEGCRKFTTISSTGFKPWHGEYLTLHGHQHDVCNVNFILGLNFISLRFKFIT